MLLYHTLPPSFLCMSLFWMWLNRWRRLVLSSKIWVVYSHFLLLCLFENIFSCLVESMQGGRHGVTLLIRNCCWCDRSHLEGVHPYWTNFLCAGVFKSYVEDYVEIFYFGAFYPLWRFSYVSCNCHAAYSPLFFHLIYSNSLLVAMKELMMVVFAISPLICSQYIVSGRIATEWHVVF